MIDRQAPAKVLHEDDRVLVIQDINPQAPLHCLVIPKKHIPTLNDLAPEDDALIGEMFRRAAEMAKARGFEGLGYRTVFNCNRQAGQSVYHIHLHVLGGRPFGWPPG
jgi:histidine triad (HIT) family protein